MLKFKEIFPDIKKIKNKALLIITITFITIFFFFQKETISRFN